MPVDTIQTITPITDALLQLCATGVTAIGGVAIARFVEWLGIRNAAATRATLDELLDKAVTFGLARSQSEIREKGWDHVDVKNQAIAFALPYLTTHFPDALRAAKLDPKDPATTARLQAALLRALPQAALLASNSPATPPATAPNPPVQADLPPCPACGALPA